MTKPNIETPLPDKVYDFIEEQNLDFNLGNIVKNIMRFRKSGSVDSLLKARWFIERELKYAERIDMNRSNC